MFMTLLSVSIVNVILPSIKHTFEADDSQLQWVVSGYALAFGVLLVAAGRTGDVYGRGRLFVAGLAVFGLGSLLAGLAPNTTVLNIARALTGLGSGALGPQIIGLIQQFFSGSKRGRAFGLFGAVVGVSVAIGPVLGGVLIAVFGAEWGWRASILINVPIAAFAILMSKKWFPAGAWEPVPAADQPAGIQREGVEVSGDRAKADIDPVGITLFGLSVLLVMLPFMEARASAWFWAALPVGLVLLVGWVFWERAYERRGRSPWWTSTSSKRVLSPTAPR
ncbi:MFS transporter [Pseudoglutamicibacter albus]|uniref:MFS transporter n=1 Tax=Pseudoglutamicibacter albus TaxID=98671 RepID=UPI003616994D